MDLQDIIATLADPEAREPLRAALVAERRRRIAGLTGDQKTLLRVLDDLEAVDPQTPEGVRRKAHLEAAAARSEASGRTRAAAAAVRSVGCQLQGHLNAVRAQAAERRRTDPTGLGSAWAAALDDSGPRRHRLGDRA